MFSVTFIALLLAPGTSWVMVPAVVTALPLLAPKLAFKRSEKPSIDAELVTLRLCCGATLVVRTLAKVMGEGVAAPVARRKTAPFTATFWLGKLNWQFGEQLLTLLASETKEIVAVPFFDPAAAVSMPTLKVEALVAPGTSKLKLPLAVIGALPLMLALSAACGATVATLVTLTKPLGEADPMRTLPKLIGLLLIKGLAVLMTLAWMEPATP